MSNLRVSDLTGLTTPTGGDLLHIIDVTNTSYSPQGTDSKITITNFVAYLNSNLSFLSASSVATLTNKTFDTAGTGNVFKINGTAISAITGTGAVVLATSPTLVTPTLGVATVTTLNGLTITSSTGVLTIANGKTATVNNSLTLAGTDGTTMTFPGSSDTIAGLAVIQTFTNKRITKRVNSVSSSATPTINTDTTDVFKITALATAITSMTTNLSGTPTDGQTLIVSITDNGTARAITWGASFESSGNVALPTTTVISTRLDVGFIWNTATSAWRCLAVS